MDCTKWKGNIYKGKDLPKGYRLLISKLPVDNGNISHFSGVVGGYSPECKCPNCHNQMFPALNIKMTDIDVAVWNSEYLHILFCPFCAFFMEPYWVKFDGHKVEKIAGGDRTSPEVIQNIELPYENRSIQPVPLQKDEYPMQERYASDLLNRKKGDGVNHQIGGLPFIGGCQNLDCEFCKKEMLFAGVLDYDDKNVPLFEENHKPVALIIGDCNCMNIYTCKDCRTIGMKWVM